MVKNKRTAMVGTLVMAVFLSLLTVMTPGKALAYNSFISIPGIDGESTDSAHLRWIDVIDWSYGETNPTTIGGTGTATAQRPTMQNLKFSMRTNQSSPKLFLACVNGTLLQSATLEVCKSPGTAKSLSITLTGVVVSSFETQVNMGSTDLLEKVSLNFGKIEIAYTLFDPVSGAPRPSVIGGYDVNINRGIGSLASVSGSGFASTGGPTAGTTTQPSQAICFMRISGIVGESTEGNHKEWVDVLNWGFKDDQIATAISLSTGGIGKGVPQDLRVSVRTSKASPLLFLASANGARISGVVLEAYRPGVDTSGPSIRITLSDVLISSFLSLGSAGSIVDEILLKFGKIRIEYTAPGGVRIPAVEWAPFSRSL